MLPQTLKTTLYRLKNNDFSRHYQVRKVFIGTAINKQNITIKLTEPIQNCWKSAHSSYTSRCSSPHLKSELQAIDNIQLNTKLLKTDFQSKKSLILTSWTTTYHHKKVIKSFEENNKKNNQLFWQYLPSRFKENKSYNDQINQTSTWRTLLCPNF